MLVKLMRSTIVIITLSLLARPQKGEVRWLAREEGIRITAGEIAHKHRKCHCLSKCNETSRLVHMNRGTTIIFRRLA